MSNRVLILGAEGVLGAALARGFRQAGWNADRYHPGSDMVIAARGVRWIVNALDPAEARRAGMSELTHAMLAAAGQNGASILQRGDLLVYGKAPAPWTIATPHAPCCDLGRQLAVMEARLRDKAAELDRTIVLLRAGELVMAESPHPLLNRLILSEVERGRIIAPGPPDLPRVHADIEDYCEIAMGLADTADTMPGFLELGFPGTRFSTRELADEVQRQARRKMDIARFPWAVLRLTALWRNAAREALETRYLFDQEQDFEDSNFVALFPEFQAKPLERIVFEHLWRRGMIPAS
ncbi:epimerase [Pseudothioclava arenosa]|uniref:Epimerase n=1 Tax=Pseudothioclava arenosa TaxID=1795308 RepID=A0A2A4CPZ1_9RHOB|nr:epimerase [Pseudothioclava arenosa]PCD76675.1 epimerase [Pseudothioclava arenosa]